MTSDIQYRNIKSELEMLGLKKAATAIDSLMRDRNDLIDVNRELNTRIKAIESQSGSSSINNENIIRLLMKIIGIIGDGHSEITHEIQEQILELNLDSLPDEQLKKQLGSLTTRAAFIAHEVVDIDLGMLATLKNSSNKSTIEIDFELPTNYQSIPQANHLTGESLELERVENPLTKRNSNLMFL